MSKNLQLMFGNQDSENLHPFPKDWARKLVVLQERVTMVQGELVSLKGGSGIQNYEPAHFDQMADKNFFVENELRVTVLHDPRKAAPEAGDQAPAKPAKAKGKGKAAPEAGDQAPESEDDMLG